MDDSTKGSPPGFKYPLESLTICSLWVHRKGGLYLVMGMVRCATNGPFEGKEDVLYWSFKNRTWNRRAPEEFLDGRFRPATETEKISAGQEYPPPRIG